jgi:hypothetical protein
MIAIIIVTTTNGPGTIALSGTSTAASCGSIRRGCAGLRITRTLALPAGYRFAPRCDEVTGASDNHKRSKFLQPP